jgi:ArsR family transcriptional regulator, arsenate/arsenite/antimonite-responsive transcriptional repressor
MSISIADVRVEKVFRALSDATRLRILKLLRAGELCVCDIVDVLDVPQPTASRHLAYLRHVRLVIVRHEGRWAYYRLAAARTRFHKMLFACLDCCPEVSLQLVTDGDRLLDRGQSDCCS